MVHAKSQRPYTALAFVITFVAGFSFPTQSPADVRYNSECNITGSGHEQRQAVLRKTVNQPDLSQLSHASAFLPPFRRTELLQGLLTRLHEYGANLQWLGTYHGIPTGHFAPPTAWTGSIGQLAANAYPGLTPQFDQGVVQLRECNLAVHPTPQEPDLKDCVGKRIEIDFNESGFWSLLLGQGRNAYVHYCLQDPRMATILVGVGSDSIDNEVFGRLRQIPFTRFSEENVRRVRSQFTSAVDSVFGNLLASSAGQVIADRSTRISQQEFSQQAPAQVPNRDAREVSGGTVSTPSPASPASQASAEEEAVIRTNRDRCAYDDDRHEPWQAARHERPEVFRNDPPFSSYPVFTALELSQFKVRMRSLSRGQKEVLMRKYLEYLDRSIASYGSAPSDENFHFYGQGLVNNRDVQTQGGFTAASMNFSAISNNPLVPVMGGRVESTLRRCSISPTSETAAVSGVEGASCFYRLQFDLRGSSSLFNSIVQSVYYDICSEPLTTGDPTRFSLFMRKFVRIGEGNHFTALAANLHWSVATVAESFAPPPADLFREFFAEISRN